MLIVNNLIITLPSPRIILSWWSFGSLLALCLVVQLLTGLFLAMHYVADTNLSFFTVLAFNQDVNQGWLLRFIHANGARFFFIYLYCHIARGLYYGSFTAKPTWLVGVVIALALMAAAFLGYVLPWGQISFWGATVITSLFTAFPYIGHSFVLWLWGGFSVDNTTLTRFFAFHFLVPFILAALAAVHVFFLHTKGSSNPLGLRANKDKISLKPYFLFKDLVGFVVTGFVLIVLSRLTPWDLGDPENFIPANPLIAPLHIQPEWYFLFAYAILRSIPNKLGGVIALGLAILILGMLRFTPQSSLVNLRFSTLGKIIFWTFVANVCLLTWIGARPVEFPYVQAGQILRTSYFTYYFTRNAVNSFWWSVLQN